MSNPVLLSHIESMVFGFSEIHMTGGNGTNSGENNDTNPDEKSSVVNSLRKAWETSKPSLGAAFKNIGTGVSRASGNLIHLGKEAIDQAGKFNKILSIHEKPEDQLDIEKQLSWICRERKRKKATVDSLFDEAFKKIVGSEPKKYEEIDVHDVQDLKHKIFLECQKYT